MHEATSLSPQLRGVDFSKNELFMLRRWGEKARQGELVSWSWIEGGSEASCCLAR
jgi:hypothetical protein